MCSATFCWRSFGGRALRIGSLNRRGGAQGGAGNVTMKWIKIDEFFKKKSRIQRPSRTVPILLRFQIKWIDFPSGGVNSDGGWKKIRFWSVRWIFEELNKKFEDFYQFWPLPMNIKFCKVCLNNDVIRGLKYLKWHWGRKADKDYGFEKYWKWRSALDAFTLANKTLTNKRNE